MSTTLVFVELPRQIDTLLTVLRQRNIVNYKIVALTPHVEYELEKRALPCKCPEDYYSESELNLIGLNDLKTLDHFSSLMNQRVKNHFTLFKNPNIDTATLSWYTLKILFNSISVRAFVLSNILTQENPDNILYFDTLPEPIENNLYFSHESAWSRTIHAGCLSRNISYESLGDDTDPTELQHKPTKRTSSPKGIKHIIRRIVPKNLIPYVYEINNAIRLIMWLIQKNFNNTPTVLVLEKAYSLQLLTKHPNARKKFNFLYWNGQHDTLFFYLIAITSFALHRAKSETKNISMFQMRGATLWQQCKNDPNISSVFNFSDINCIDILNSRLEKFCTDIISQISITYDKTTYINRHINPQAIIAATMGSYITQTISISASQQQVPFVVYRHGDCGAHVMMESMPHPVIDRIEMQSADYVLTFGNGDVQYLEKGDHNRAKAISVGSAILDELKLKSRISPSQQITKRLGLDPNKRIVVYVPTTMDGNIRIVPYRSQSPSRRFFIEREIISTFSKHPHIQFIIKLPVIPNYPFSPSAGWLEDLQLENCFIVTEPFMNIIPIADMFITDYTSTNFLEMLTTTAPILVCGHEFPLPWNSDTWHPSILPMWKDRVEYYDDINEFKEQLDFKLTSMNFDRICCNNTMLELFGTHLNDGHSLDRASSTLEQICSDNIREKRERIN